VPHFFPGSTGLVTAVLILLIAWVVSYSGKKYASYDLDPKGVVGTFEPILARYLRIAEFIIGIDTGSIVLIVGSSALHGQAGHLPWVYASPLLLLGCSVIYGVIFMACLIMNDENVRHGKSSHSGQVRAQRDLWIRLSRLFLRRVHLSGRPGHAMNVGRVIVVEGGTSSSPAQRHRNGRHSSCQSARPGFTEAQEHERDDGRVHPAGPARA
jgi:hypothetical protein